MKKRHFNLLLVFLLLVSAGAQAQDDQPYEQRLKKRYRMDPVINTLVHDEFAPTSSTDGNTLIFQSNREGKKWGHYRLYSTSKNEKDMWTTPEPIASINDKAADGEMVTGPWLSYDGLTLYFSANYADGAGDFDLYHAKRESMDAEWGEPVALPGAVNSADYEGFPSVSADGKRIYFMKKSAEGAEEAPAAEESTEDGKKKADGKSATRQNTCYTLMVSKQDADGNWGAPEELPAPLNGDCSKAPRVLGDGQVLFFSSLREATKRGERVDARDFDVFVTRMDESGQWSDPENVEPINRYSSEGFVHVIPQDNATALVYFNAQMNASHDLYYAILSKQYTGSEIEDVCIHVTDSLTGEDLAQVLVKVDNKTRTQLSNEYKTDEEGMIRTIITEGNVYDITIEHEGYQKFTYTWDYSEKSKLREIRCLEARLRREDVGINIRVVKGDSDEPVDAKLTITTADNESVAVDKVKAGQFKASGEKGKKYTATAEAEGLATATQEIDLTDVEYGEVVDVLVRMYDEMDAEFDNVNFTLARSAVDDAAVREKNMKSLGSVVKFMKDYPKARIRIEAHTDERGGDAYNQGLSERRAKAVKDYLVGQGIAADRLESIGYGETRPAQPNRVDGILNETNMAINRRVEFKLIK
ncbi:MAG: OmpA family protein [Bernardetiaceae bacterium]